MKTKFQTNRIFLWAMSGDTDLIFPKLSVALVCSGLEVWLFADRVGTLAL